MQTAGSTRSHLTAATTKTHLPQAAMFRPGLEPAGFLPLLGCSQQCFCLGNAGSCTNGRVQSANWMNTAGKAASGTETLLITLELQRPGFPETPGLPMCVSEPNACPSASSSAPTSSVPVGADPGATDWVRLLAPPLTSWHFAAPCLSFLLKMRVTVTTRN